MNSTYPSSLELTATKSCNRTIQVEGSVEEQTAATTTGEIKVDKSVELIRSFLIGLFFDSHNEDADGNEKEYPQFWFECPACT